MAKGFRDNRQFSTETVHLGTFMHPAGDLLVLKLEHKDIPYPNSPVMFKRKQIGKVDEIFGPVGDVYVSVRPDPGTKISNFSVEAKFEGYKDRFIPSSRFLPREEVEKRKEQADKKKKPEGPKPKGKGVHRNGGDAMRGPKGPGRRKGSGGSHK